jgi:hypothetical protein
MSESAETAKNAPEGGQPAPKQRLQKLINYIPATVGISALVGLPSLIVNGIRDWAVAALWKVPIRGAIIASVLLIVLYLIFPFLGKLIGKKSEKTREKFERMVPVLDKVIGVLSILIVIIAGAIFVVTKNAPLKTIVLANNRGIKGKSVSITKDMPDIELYIEGGPMKAEPGNVSFELRRDLPKRNDKAPLDISGLQRDEEINGKFYFPQQGWFKVPGPFVDGDHLVFNTTSDSGFEGKITFEFWEPLKERTLSGFKGNIVFQQKEQNPGTGTLSDFEGKIMLESWKIPMEESKEDKKEEQPKEGNEGEEQPKEGNEGEEQQQ